MIDKVVAVDFDGCLAITDYPKIIAPISRTIEYIKYLKNQGATIILWTCREGIELQEALKFCKENDIPIDYANENAPYRIDRWHNDCRKIGADIYIDDKALNSLSLCI